MTVVICSSLLSLTISWENLFINFLHIFIVKNITYIYDLSKSMSFSFYRCIYMPCNYNQNSYICVWVKTNIFIIKTIINAKQKLFKTCQFIWEQRGKPINTSSFIQCCDTWEHSQNNILINIFLKIYYWNNILACSKIYLNLFVSGLD